MMRFLNRRLFSLTFQFVLLSTLFVATFATNSTTTPAPTPCDAGFYRYEDGVCIFCELDTWCADDIKHDCPAGSHSPTGSTSVAACQPCPPGAFCYSFDNFELCPENTWCLNGVRHDCDPSFVSPEGSSSADACVCGDNTTIYREPACPTGYTEFESSGRCYKRMDTVAMTLLDANMECINNGATLVNYLGSEDEYRFLFDLHNCSDPTDCFYWISAYRADENEPLTWVDYFNGVIPNQRLDTLDESDVGLNGIMHLKSYIWIGHEQNKLRSAWWYSQNHVMCVRDIGAAYCLPPTPTRCDIGSYGTFATGCNICEVGHYCPGGLIQIPCPNNALTFPLFGAQSVADCQAPVCGNYHVEPGEECDNGPSDGDGCSSECEFEDSTGTAAGPEWVCTSQALATTSCCASVQNPISGEYVCNCNGVVSTVPGITIRSDCSVKDVDECRNNNGGCFAGAMCLNHAATLHTNMTHECICPPGMVGDGINRCDVYIYRVNFKLAVQGVSKFDVNYESIKQSMIDDGVVPADTLIEKIQLFVTSYNGPFNSRRLLETGIEIESSVEVESSLEMQTLVNNINTEQAITTFADSFGVGTNVELLQEPTESIQTIDQAFGSVSTVLTGFQVDSIVYDNVNYEWILRARYVNDAPNVITSMYMSKGGVGPYSQDTRDTFSVSQHPCMKTGSVCCMNDYKGLYTIGTFEDNITDSIGACNTDVSNSNTLGLFNPARNQHLVDQMLDEYPNSYVKRINANTVDVHIYRVDLRDSLSMRTNIVGGYDMDFFLGMAYYTLLPAPAMATVASQTRVKASFTDTVAFATASKQEYTFLEYITVSLFDTKLITDIVNVQHPQSVRVGMVVPGGLQQNMRTGLVPLTSVRYAIATSLPDASDATAWKNPCRSADSSGLWDSVVGGNPNPLYDLYSAAASQTCSMQPDLCTNPIKAEIRDRLIEFWFPLGDNTATNEMLNSAQAYSIYIYFDLSVIDSTGSSVRTKLFAQSTLSELSMTMMCETLELAAELTDIMDVSMAVGIVGTAGEWDATMKVHENILSLDTNLLDLSNNVASPTIQNGLITLVVDGQDASFTGALSTDYKLEIDDMVSLHFLDEASYDTAIDYFEDGTAWTLDQDDTTGFLEIALSPQVVQSCMSTDLPGDMSCVIRRDIAGRAVPNDYAVHPFATGMNTHDLNMDSAWLQRHLLGYSENSDALARNFTNMVRSRYAINDRYKKAWFINPGYPWSVQANSGAQSVLSLSDRTVIVAVVSLDDGSGFTGRRRMLLQVTSNGQKTTQKLTAIKERPAGATLPPINNVHVDNYKQIANAFGIANKFAFLKIPMQTIVTRNTPHADVRDTLQHRMQQSLAQWAPNATRAWIVQYTPKSNSALQRRRNMLSVDKTDTLVADLLVLLDMTSYENLLYPDVLKNALNENTTDNAAQMVHVQQVLTDHYKALIDQNGNEALYARVRDGVINLHAKDTGGQSVTDYQVPMQPTYDSFKSSASSGVTSSLFSIALVLVGVLGFVNRYSD